MRPLPLLVAACAALAMVPALPAEAAAVPALLCQGSCTIPGGVLPGFLPPVSVVTSGSAVTWVGSDAAGHLNVENALLPDQLATCFEASYAGASGATVVFRLDAGSVVAEVDGRERTCASAQPLAGGAAVLTYACIIHALTMKGALVIIP